MSIDNLMEPLSKKARAVIVAGVVGYFGLVGYCVYKVSTFPQETYSVKYSE